MKLRVTREEIRSSANRMMYDRYTSVTLATTALRYSWIRGCSISDGTSSNEVIILLIRSIIPRWRLLLFLNGLGWKIKEREEGKKKEEEREKEKEKKWMRRFMKILFLPILFYFFVWYIIFHVVAINWCNNGWWLLMRNRVNVNCWRLSIHTINIFYRLLNTDWC